MLRYMCTCPNRSIPRYGLSQIALRYICSFTESTYLGKCPVLVSDQPLLLFGQALSPVQLTRLGKVIFCFTHGKSLIHVSRISFCVFRNLFRAGRVGLEPTSFRLTADCSTYWATNPLKNRLRVFNLQTITLVLCELCGLNQFPQCGRPLVTQYSCPVKLPKLASGHTEIRALDVRAIWFIFCFSKNLFFMILSFYFFIGHIVNIFTFYINMIDVFKNASFFQAARKYHLPAARHTHNLCVLSSDRYYLDKY